MPVSVAMNAGTGPPGLTSVWNSPSTSPPRTLTAPISVIADPAGRAARGLQVHTTNVTSRQRGADLVEGELHGPAGRGGCEVRAGEAADVGHETDANDDIRHGRGRTRGRRRGPRVRSYCGRMTGDDGAGAGRDPEPPPRSGRCSSPSRPRCSARCRPPTSRRPFARCTGSRPADGRPRGRSRCGPRSSGTTPSAATWPRVWARTHPEARRTAAEPTPDDAAGPPRDDAAGPTPEDAADPVQGVDAVQSAAGAWLLRTDGWRERVAAVASAEPVPDAAPGTVAAPLLARAERAEAEAVRLAVTLAATEDRLAGAEDDLATLRREARRLRADADRARNEAREAAARAAEVLAEAGAARDAAESARSEAATCRREAEELQRAARGDGAAGPRPRVRPHPAAARHHRRRRDRPARRPGAAARGDAPGGPRRAAAARTPPAGRRSRGRSADDPALLDELLALPHAHLVVDGYNVTKTAWPELTLADQRARLVDALGNLAGRTGAEVTCCFDGQDGTASRRGRTGGPGAVLGRRDRGRPHPPPGARGAARARRGRGDERPAARCGPRGGRGAGGAVGDAGRAVRPALTGRPTRTGGVGHPPCRRWWLASGPCSSTAGPAPCAARRAPTAW